MRKMIRKRRTQIYWRVGQWVTIDFYGGLVVPIWQILSIPTQDKFDLMVMISPVL